ncbi:MAG: TetR/AcrR family transcriptional regulator [Thermodesulfobacteriota bacterium]|nr:MAG: TetR/AcrR family transcriptional regulator [Thermodesulfobacteriota bacterium]RLG12060.1 MAG: TetR/AcrR family transcriptional regulator [Candidatus Pacearchaeota archaeon]
MSNTREKILKIALTLFSKKGYLGATTREIAQKAGITEVTLFRYFPNKETLFKEVINTYSFLPKLKIILDESEIKNKSVEEILKNIAYNFLETLEEKKDLINIMHLEIQRYPQKVKKIFEAIIESTLDLISSYFEKMQQKKIFKKISPQIAARAFLGMIYSYFYAKEIIKYSENFSKKEIIENYINIYLNGILKK